MSAAGCLFPDEDPDREVEELLVEVGRALEAADPAAACRALDRTVAYLAAGPALADVDLLCFAHARLHAYAFAEAARLEEELARLEEELARLDEARRAFAPAPRGPYPSSARSSATA